jgi:signal transduction histidine kinase
VLLVKEQTARREAEQANRVKDEFLAAVSHELRTPLTTIKTLTRVLQRREMTEAERAEYLADIASECDREIDLVLNLLDLSRIKASGVQIQLKRTDAGEVVSACEKARARRSRTAWSGNFRRNRAGFAFYPRRPQRTAPRSVRDCRKRDKIYAERRRVTIRAAKCASEEVSIEIEDDGRGIAEEDLPRVFDKFYRGQNAGGAMEASAEEVPGIGLGLNLAQTLVEGMNGKITVESRLKEGTKFTVSCQFGRKRQSGNRIERKRNKFAPVDSVSARRKNGKKYDQAITRR